MPAALHVRFAELDTPGRLATIHKFDPAQAPTHRYTEAVELPFSVAKQDKLRQQHKESRQLNKGFDALWGEISAPRLQQSAVSMARAAVVASTPAHRVKNPERSCLKAVPYDPEQFYNGSPMHKRLHLRSGSWTREASLLKKTRSLLGVS